MPAFLCESKTEWITQNVAQRDNSLRQLEDGFVIEVRKQSVKKIKA